MIGALAASGATLAATALKAAAPEKRDLASVKKETDFACLYHCDFGPRRFSQMLLNMHNHYSAYDFRAQARDGRALDGCMCSPHSLRP
jgi:uncharacterized protein